MQIPLIEYAFNQNWPSPNPPTTTIGGDLVIGLQLRALGQFHPIVFFVLLLPILFPLRGY